MGDRTKIEWADATWNPVTGCTKVSPGCDHCYIDRTPPFRMEGRKFIKLCPRCKGHGIIDAAEHACPECFDGTVPGNIGATTGVRLHPSRLDQPLHWQKPRRVFVNSLSDLFHDEVPDEYIARIWAVMALAPQHRFMVLTKRHGRMRSLLNSPDFLDEVRDHLPAGLPGWPLPNVWLGVTVEDQKRADLRIPALVKTPAVVRFLSCEPLLGPITFTRLHATCPTHDFVGGFCSGPCEDLRFVDWVIAGGESGPGARPMHPDWARSIRDQCVGLGVAFHFKQWGDCSLWVDRLGDVWAHGDDGLMESFETAPFPREHVEKKWGPLKQLSKRAAGRELDGRTWDEEPPCSR